MLIVMNMEDGMPLRAFMATEAESCTVPLVALPPHAQPIPQPRLQEISPSLGVACPPPRLEAIANVSLSAFDG